MAETETKRIAWLSPYGPRSDIGAFTRNLLPHWAKGAPGGFEAHLWVNENGPVYAADVPTFPLKSQANAPDLLSLYDFTLFNVGNNQENHLDIFSSLKTNPGVVILHDYVYQHFFAWECFEKARTPESYARLMGAYYGGDALGVVERSGICGPTPLYAPWDSPHAQRFPLFEPIAGLASALVVHSEFAARAVSPKFDGPVLRLALPHDQKSSLSAAEIAAWARHTEIKERLRYTCFGHISRAKLLDRVIEAFAASPLLRAKGELTIAGHPGDTGYVAELEGLILAHGLTGLVHIELAVSDERLRALKTETDVFVNIRSPNTEAGSGSLTEQLNTGRPLVVFDSGCYADLPDGAALKWRDLGDLGELIRALESLAKTPARRVAIGATGRDFVRKIGGAEYIAELKAFLLAEESWIKGLHSFAALRRPARKLKAHAAKIDETRRMWRLLEADAFAWSPQPYVEWQSADAIALARTLLRPVDKAQFDRAAQRLSAEGPIAFFEAVSGLRSILRDVALLEEQRDADLDGAPCHALPVWQLAATLEPAETSKAIHAGLLRCHWAGSHVFWTQALQADVPAPLVLLALLNDKRAPVAGTAAAFRTALRTALGEGARPQRLAKLVKAAAHAGAWVGAGGAEAPPPAKAEFDERGYLAAYPDVQSAVQAGRFASGHEHYRLHGVEEGRIYLPRDIAGAPALHQG